MRCNVRRIAHAINQTKNRPENQKGFCLDWKSQKRIFPVYTLLAIPSKGMHRDLTNLLNLEAIKAYETEKGWGLKINLDWAN